MLCELHFPTGMLTVVITIFLGDTSFSRVWEEVKSIDLAEGIREETKSIAGRRNEKTCVWEMRNICLAPTGIKKTEANR